MRRDTETGQHSVAVPIRFSDRYAVLQVFRHAEPAKSAARDIHSLRADPIVSRPAVKRKSFAFRSDSRETDLFPVIFARKIFSDGFRSKFQPLALPEAGGFPGRT